jgi:sulfate/thiosulfate transport system substrate-binding protein
MNQWLNLRGRWRRGMAAIGLLLAVTIVACGSPFAKSNDIELILVGYAVPKIAHNAIIPKFVEQWQRDHNGQKVIFKKSYGGSGSQTRAVVDGLDADVVHLAIGADLDKLVKEGLVKADWAKRVPNHGIVSQTVAAIVTRKGNPKQINTFADLTRPDVKWVTANPKTSGGARWNYYAIWNYAAKTTDRDAAKSQEMVTKAFHNVAVLTKDAREAVDAFAHQGQGDALLNYENEIILANQKGANLDFVVPAINLSIDTPIAVVDQNVDKHGNRAAAEAFVKFLFTADAQAEFAKVGFRPLTAASPTDLPKFVPIEQLGTIADYGGWKVAQKAFEEGGTFDQIEASMGKRQ